jgi:hypothetical protein
VAEEFLVYPQPATDQLSIRDARSSNSPVHITDLAGQLVYTGRTNGLLTTLDVSTFASGLYVLQVGEVKRTIAVQ